MYKIISRFTYRTINVLLKKEDKFYLLGEGKIYNEEEIYLRFIHVHYQKII